MILMMQGLLTSKSLPMKEENTLLTLTVISLSIVVVQPTILHQMEITPLEMVVKTIHTKPSMKHGNIAQVVIQSLLKMVYIQDKVYQIVTPQGLPTPSILLVNQKMVFGLRKPTTMSGLKIVIIVTFILPLVVVYMVLLISAEGWKVSSMN